jgi:hypothetical protein
LRRKYCGSSTSASYTYRLQFGGDGQSLEWLTMDDECEVLLLTEVDTTFLFRPQNSLFGPFVPEQAL